ncbi:MAG: Peptidoglycan D,D-transpeptidase MrdA [uncultured Acidimicrobiales bacterium]|uniref:Beta-lactamase n=1 Tax=uncultured Acidimicrobiales bacterium TaxID=310071 RepID=A0A6J4IZC7_9ACTN|nr:MAG: Peptidoglycan D,D-transpeptidase MrdA [uncultured Acidimicrobiales bacterium]
MTQDSSRLRLGVLGMVVLSLFCALSARLWYLQVLASPTLAVEAQHNSVAVVYTEAPRGRILDRNGKVLADNRVVLALVANREEVGKRPEVLDRLSALIGVPVNVLNERMADERYSLFKPVPVAVDVPKDKLIYVREHQGDFPGIQGVQVTERVYPHGALAAHVLGTVGEINDEELGPRKAAGYKAGDTIGKSGIELTYETDLRGEPEISKLEVDSVGRVQRSLGGQPAVQGNDVRLTIDLDIQRAAEDSLAQGIVLARKSTDFLTGKPFLAPGGSVVVTDPRNGSVLAMASNPAFNPNEFTNGISVRRFAELNDPAGHYPLNNRAIQGLYAPGSTFKLATSIAGLRAGLITPRDTYNDQGAYTVVGQRSATFTNARGARNGLVDVAKALTVSSDVFYYWLGERFWDGRGSLGQAAIQDVGRSLGMGEYTDIDLPFESNGRVSDPAGRQKLHKDNPEAFPYPEWYTGDNLNIAVGQGDTAITPLQLTNAYASFINGGTVYAPHVGDAVLDRQGQEIRRVEAKVLRRVEIPASIREPLLAGFRGVVADPLGTGFGVFSGFPLAAFPVAGKTGTAEVGGKQDTSLFTAYAPADSPRYAVSAVLEESGLGASAAGPVVRRVFEAIAVKEGISTAPPADVNRVDGRD